MKFRDAMQILEPEEAERHLAVVRAFVQRSTPGLVWDQGKEELLRSLCMRFSIAWGRRLLNCWWELIGFEAPDEDPDFDAELYAVSLQGVGLETYLRTWASSPERIVIEEGTGRRSK